MLNLLKFEFRRIFKSVFFRIVGGYCILWPLLVAVFYRIIFGLAFMDTDMSYADFAMSDSEIRYFTWIISIAFVNDLPKFVALFTCIHIGKDFSDGIVRNKITAGHSRTSIFFSYIISQIAATVALCIVYISFALLGLLITGIGVNLNGGEMFIRHMVGICIVLVFTVMAVALSLVFRKRALPIIMSILVVMFVSTATTVFGLFKFNMPGKAVDDYIEKRHERYEEMVDEGLMTDETVEFLEENYNRKFYLGMAWEVGRPVYLITNLGFNQDYAVDLSQAIASNPDYTDEIDFSSSLTGGMYNPDMCDLQPKDFKHTDSMHISYAQLNTTYVVRSLIYILVIGGYGYFVFGRKNLF